MKILHVTFAYPPKQIIGDGTTQAVYSLTQKLSKRGHDVTVYTSNLLSLFGKTAFVADRRVRINNVEVYYFPAFARYRTMLITPSMISTVRNQIEDFDVVHIHDARSFQGIIVRHFAQKLGTPFVFQPHGSYISPRSSRLRDRIGTAFIDKLFGDRIVLGAKKIIALNQWEAQMYVHFGVASEKVAIVPNGVDMLDYSDLPQRGSFRKKLAIPSTRKVILYLGRIHKIKGLDLLVKAYAYLVENMSYSKATLVIVGPDDGYLNELQELVKTLKLEDKIMILGPLFRRNKLEAYVDADVYVLPSRYEIFGIAVLEAYACGKPVVASNVEGLRNLVTDKITGLLFEPGNVKQLAHSLHAALTDADMAARMLATGRQFVENSYSIDRVVEKLEDLYRQLV